jgi:hypothetical protein
VHSCSGCVFDALLARLLSEVGPRSGNISRHAALILDAVQRLSGLYSGSRTGSMSLGRARQSSDDPS